MVSEPHGLDAAEVEALVIRTADDLYRRALKNMQGDRPAAEDLVQEVFHAAVRSWGKIRPLPPDQQRAWLFAVLRNKFADHNRSCQRLEPVGDLPGSDSAADDVDRVALSRIVVERCWKVIKKMPPVRHRVAILRWGENWTPKEIAAALGMTQSTVRGHLKRARDQLAAEVGPDLLVVDEFDQDPDTWQGEGT
jgi:RNA polymerase sigma-70 factor (ECF subfamily)